MPTFNENKLPDPLGFNGQRKRRKKLKTDSFYNSKQWRSTSKRYLKKNPLCEIDGCEDLADHVDHIQPWQSGGKKYDISNLQSICKSCHGRKTMLENIANGYI